MVSKFYCRDTQKLLLSQAFSTGRALIGGFSE
jgi:hypothetical protein